MVALVFTIAKAQSRTIIDANPLADQWSAHVTSRNGFASKSSSPGIYYYDRRNERVRTSTEMDLGFFHVGRATTFDSLSKNTTGLNSNTTVGRGDDAVCKASTVPYSDPFAWLIDAQRNGSSVVDGEPCEIWVGFGGFSMAIFQLPAANMSLCITKLGAPREWNISATIPIGGMSNVFSVTYHFFNVEVGHLPETAFDNSDACATNYPTSACPSTEIETLNLYRIHSLEEPDDLGNRNLGDALGDMAFMCETSQQGALQSNVVTWWQVDSSTSYGQYAYCLFNLHHRNECFGGTTNKVGRESAQGAGLGHLQGQCSSNNDVGSWYSFPTAGECAAGTPVGTNDCTWGNARRLRTVNASCILHERGLQQACAKEVGHAPFTVSTEIFVRALASDDPSKGGCPDVGGFQTLLV